jgi:hypothetical protein
MHRPLGAFLSVFVAVLHGQPLGPPDQLWPRSGNNGADSRQVGNRIRDLISSDGWADTALTHRVLWESAVHRISKRKPFMTNMRRPFCLLLPLFIVLLAPTGAWEASVSQNLSITITVATIGPAFYVATNGSDSNSGTLTAPFATLSKAQAAMRASPTIKTTYIRAGTYSYSGSNNCTEKVLDFTSSDNGETWSYYPPDGPGSAILDGGASSPSTGYLEGFAWDNADNITVNGLQFQHFCTYGAFNVNAYNGGTDSNTMIVNNIIHDMYDVGIQAQNNVQNLTIANNYIYNIQNNGIDVLSSSGKYQFNGLVIENNFIYNTCANTSDCGAIYIQDDVQPSATGIRVSNNYIRDAGAGGGGRGIYLDDGSSNVAVSGNIVAGVMNACFNIHGGSNDVYSDNICDEGSSGSQGITIYQQTSASGTWPMTGNQYENNIIIAGSTGGGGGYNVFGVGGPAKATIQNNAYYNYVGSSVNSTGSSGAGSDSNPTYENPQLSCWAYSIAPGSRVFNSPVNLSPIASGWGPPGFVIPQIGTPPSSPHGC